MLISSTIQSRPRLSAFRRPAAISCRTRDGSTFNILAVSLVVNVIGCLVLMSFPYLLSFATTRADTCSALLWPYLSPSFRICVGQTHPKPSISIAPILRSSINRNASRCSCVIVVSPLLLISLTYAIIAQALISVKNKIQVVWFNCVIARN